MRGPRISTRKQVTVIRIAMTVCTRMAARLHKDPQPGVEEFPDHNDGAYYVSDSVSRDTNRLAHDKLAELLLANLIGHELSTLSLCSFSILNADDLRYCRLSGIARVPLFLRDASIRC